MVEADADDVITELDAIMDNKYTRQLEKLRAWQSARHVERAPQREKKPRQRRLPRRISKVWARAFCGLSHRDKIIQPRVARHELPWVAGQEFPQP